MMGRNGMFALLAVGVVLGGCGKKKEPATPTPTTTTPPPVSSSPSDTAGNGARAAAAAAEADRRRAEAASTGVRNTLGEMVFFEYDRAEIRSDMQDVLNRKAAIMRSNPNVTVRIDGHADERGTVEYNLALSLRRANVVRDYLTGFGIDASRLEVTGFGEERPLDSSGSEDAFARNRRAEFQITRGGDILVPGR